MANCPGGVPPRRGSQQLAWQFLWGRPLATGRAAQQFGLTAGKRREKTRRSQEQQALCPQIKMAAGLRLDAREEKERGGG